MLLGKRVFIRRNSLKSPVTKLLLTVSLTLIFLAALAPGIMVAAEPIELENRRELFIDDFLIGELKGTAEQELHQPEIQEIVLKHDAPWEGSGSGYHSIFKDGDIYRMYYKAWHLEVTDKGLNTGKHPLYCCYAESRDGIHWEKPNLGICEFNGSKENNIILYPGQFPEVNADPGHPAIFKDTNPDCPPESRYKAIIRSSKPHGLLAFHSADGIHFEPMQNEPVITEGAFDSQNLAFWDTEANVYRAYWRVFTGGVTDGDNWKPSGDRAIRTATSKDFLNWGPFEDLTYEDSPSEELYTNQIKPYDRAPHLLLGFPARYVERGWSPAMEQLPETEQRHLRSKSSDRYGMALSEGLLMASRNGTHFKRWNEAFLPPGRERKGTWQYGHQYIGWHLVETKSTVDDSLSELSLYSTESYWTEPGSEVRRYSLRPDGFVSISADREGGELLTPPITFTGTELSLNLATSAVGSVQVEMQDANGKPLSGFSLQECDVLFGDSIDKTVSWKGSSDLGTLSSQPVRLRFVMNDADLYSLHFRKSDK
ncbi:hypothetical protein Pla110_02050 [Polystyrenella longa]|uniref:Glycosyl hydrolase family 32 N-terminal domain-containing protein n=1 Tax=Polystyrenella longa TaxID=2528007 RepID=A0A518CH00_9PLAN|nr:hypothetical protein [Polystyrenella longa]QDU78501.1 hypothetical protein Pla110_02050 [Polystyrenella longa]